MKIKPATKRGKVIVELNPKEESIQIEEDTRAARLFRLFEEGAPIRRSFGQAIRRVVGAPARRAGELPCRR